MIKINPDFERSKEVLFEPKLHPSAKKTFIKFASHLRKELNRNNHLTKSEVIELFRKDSMEEINEGEGIELSFSKSILLDLAAQGWSINFKNKNLYLQSPSLSEGSPEQIKEQIRSGHLVERDSKIKEPNTLGFIKSMESRRLTSKGWHSIFSLMRDGQDLARQLKGISEISDPEERLTRLGKTISPYLQFVEQDAICEHTGLNLNDIWRYFRLTWVSVHKSVPGRSLMVLIRDAAAPNHPVIGIAALGSSVVQQTIRDQWIGWDSEKFVSEFMAKPSVKLIHWLRKTLEATIDDLYVKDLLKDKIITKGKIRNPDEETILALQKQSLLAIKQHRLYPKASSHKGIDINDNCELRAKSDLFRSKRCNVLASLLSIRRVFMDNGFYAKGKISKNTIKFTPAVKRALKQLVRMAKGQHVGINMMDITVCGALAPYNTIIGGKLVCLLLASPEVVEHYAKRYAKQVSIIASSMKGQLVYRKPKLVLLCTTSLYGIGSSQYNRIKVPAEELGGEVGDVIQYKELGLSMGFGSFHMSTDTISMANSLIAKRKDSRKVNSIFGEGVNPLMRKIRDALQIIGLPGEKILLHGNKRIVYALDLCKNTKEILLGIESRPHYIIPQDDPKQHSHLLVNYWIERWLNNRINNPEVLEKMQQHKLSHPIVHGAKAPRPSETDDDQMDLHLFSFA